MRGGTSAGMGWQSGVVAGLPEFQVRHQTRDVEKIRCNEIEDGDRGIPAQAMNCGVATLSKGRGQAEATIARTISAILTMPITRLISISLDRSGPRRNAAARLADAPRLSRIASSGATEKHPTDDRPQGKHSQRGNDDECAVEHQVRDRGPRRWAAFTATPRPPAGTRTTAQSRPATPPCAPPAAASA